MPQVNISTSKKLDAAEKLSLYNKIGENMDILPGKNIDNTHVMISAGMDMYKSGSACDMVFLEVRLYKASPEESKSAFAKKMFAILESELGIAPSNIYINFMEFDHWASGGNYF